MSAYTNNFRSLLAFASGILDEDLTGFDFSVNNFLDDELRSQYISYVYSCSIADILKEQRVRPDWVTAYSMGLYAALYYCGAVSFRDGLMLIRKAWEAISGIAASRSYAMGMVIGLSEDDLCTLMKGSDGLWICNQNNPHTFILSGDAILLTKALESAKREGALRATPLPASKPYHTPLLKDAAPELEKLCNTLEFNAPSYPYLSSLSLETVRSAEGAKREVLMNLHHRMNWFGAMTCLIQAGMELFFECGAGDGLSRNFRFIDSSVKAFSVARLDQFLERIR